MPCESADRCALADYHGALIEHEGKTYCIFHLPLGSDQKLDNSQFAAQFQRVEHEGARDFTGIAFPGSHSPIGNPSYRFKSGLKLRRITVGPRVTLVFETYGGDLSEATFSGDAWLQVSNQQKIKCISATMEGNFVFDGVDNSSSITFEGSKFKAKCRFNSVAKLNSLSFDNCTFAVAPVFGSTQDLPQNTSFSGATFKPRFEDEHVYRSIRIHFSKNRDRDSEGRFYALEKRCQRLGLPFGLRRAISYLYDTTSTYGHSYERAIVWFAAAQVIFCLAYAGLSARLYLGGTYDSRVVAFTFAQLVKPFELFGNRLLTGTPYDIVGNDNRGWWLLLSSVQSITSIALIALFLLALRWRFMRE